MTDPIKVVHFCFENFTGRVVIVVENRSRFLPASQFLTDNNWNAEVASSLQNSIEVLTRLQPHFVFISLDFPDKRILELPYWSGNKTKAMFIGFGDHLSDTNRRKAESLNVFERIMVKNASGPTFCLEIRDILFQKFLAMQNHPAGQGNNVVGKLDLGALEVKSLGSGARLVLPQQASGKNAKSKVSIEKKTNDAKPSEKETTYRSLPETMSLILQDLSVPTEAEVGTIESCHELEVIPVFVQDLAGYLVLTSTFDSNVTRRLGKEVVDSLTQQRKSEYTPSLVSKPVSIKVDDLDFSRFARSKSDFFIIEKRGKGTVASCFLRSDSPVPKSGVPNGEGKVSIPVEQIPTNIQLPFGSYLYLKGHQKFISYLRKGGILTQSQHDRLTSHNEELYIDLSEFDAFTDLYVRTNAIRSLFSDNF